MSGTKKQQIDRKQKHPFERQCNENVAGGARGVVFSPELRYANSHV